MHRPFSDCGRILVGLGRGAIRHRPVPADLRHPLRPVLRRLAVRSARGPAGRTVGGDPREVAAGRVQPPGDRQQLRPAQEQPRRRPPTHPGPRLRPLPGRLPGAPVAGQVRPPGREVPPGGPRGVSGLHHQGDPVPGRRVPPARSPRPRSCRPWATTTPTAAITWSSRTARSWRCSRRSGRRCSARTPARGRSARRSRGAAITRCGCPARRSIAWSCSTASSSRSTTTTRAGPAPRRPPSISSAGSTQTLEQARAAGETVWLLMHVPPGINSFNSAESVMRRRAAGRRSGSRS